MAKKPSKGNSTKGNFFEELSKNITKFTGGTKAFLIALGLIIVWGLTGPVFNFSESWQLVVNTGTTIVTFLMVFLIQRTQNKDSMAIQLKLNEIIASISGASNRLIDVEEMSEKDLATLKKHFNMLARLCEENGDLTKSHSIEEAERRHKQKLPKLK